ncbi:MAG: NAD(P)/FAD-dependent oxidoreductase [Opitutae bacterium]
MAEAEQVLIVGAGMAGLACARTLQGAGVPFLLFDRDEEVGGRVRTDEVDGYRLDRGFQVLLTAYPEARKFLDYEALDLKACYPGSRVWFGDRFHRVADPFRHPIDGLLSLGNPIGALFDKIRVGMMRTGLLSTRSMPDDLSTLDALSKLGFGPAMIDRFWKPFMRGVFLENELSTTVRKFEETFRLFAQGDTVLPRLGIGELPKQMAGKLPKDSLALGTEIMKVEQRAIESADGKRFGGRAVVLATDIDPANRLLGIEDKPGQWNAVDCLYFSLPADQVPKSEPILHLDGTGQGPVNNLTFVSALCDCAPSGRALASTSVIGRQETEHEELAQEVLGQLETWFGKGIEWKFVKGYRIRQAVPACPVATAPDPVVNGVHRCGDYCGLPSIDAAMRSGRETAERIIREHTN